MTKPLSGTNPRGRPEPIRMTVSSVERFTRSGELDAGYDLTPPGERPPEILWLSVESLPERVLREIKSHTALEITPSYYVPGGALAFDVSVITLSGAIGDYRLRTVKEILERNGYEVDPMVDDRTVPKPTGGPRSVANGGANPGDFWSRRTNATVVDNPFVEGVPSAAKARAVREFLSMNGDKYNPVYVKFYHGTSPSVDATNEGLLPTSGSRRRSYQSKSGYVYLANTPERAKTFGDLANQSNSVVYEVIVPVRELKADTDQLGNLRAAGEDVGDSVAESIVYGGGARVAGKIEPWQIRRLGGGRANPAREPWMMTRDEFGFGAETDWPLKVGFKGQVYGEGALSAWYAENYGKAPHFGTVRSAQKWVEAMHRRIVRRALSEGKPVPPKVLADYPELTGRGRMAVAGRNPAKEPWQMTEEEYHQELRRRFYDEERRFGRPSRFEDYDLSGIQRHALRQRHKYAVEEALSEGKPVPGAVLAGYPELTGRGRMAVAGRNPSEASEVGALISEYEYGGDMTPDELAERILDVTDDPALTDAADAYLEAHELSISAKGRKRAGDLVDMDAAEEDFLRAVGNAIAGAKGNPGNWSVEWVNPETGRREVYQEGLSRGKAEERAVTLRTVLSPRWFGKNAETFVTRGSVAANPGKEPWQCTQSELEAVFRDSDVPVGELKAGDVIFGGGRNTKAHYPGGMTANLGYELYTVERVSPKSVGLKTDATGKMVRLEKEPWNYYPSESERRKALTVKLIPKALAPFAAMTHKAVVERALAEGKRVPANVIAEYPDLAERVRK